MTANPLQRLREHRALLLGCEAIGWLHMEGKAHPDFLRKHGGQSNGYEFKDWSNSLNPDWDSRLSWLKSGSQSITWPSSLTELLKDFDEGKSKSSVVGFLQAAHAMASGIEKNHPKETSEYLGQDVTHMWQTSPFGYPERNLLMDPPQVLQPDGYAMLLAEIARVLDGLQGLANPITGDTEPWILWRTNAIGPKSLIRRSFQSTLAETRIPNNDVTLWDQSYIASALFKSAVAGAVLAGTTDWNGLKPNTQWRLLVVGIGSEHYESRAVRIGDWTGALSDINGFFDEVCRLIEVDVAIGSLVYRDTDVMAFTFPGLRLDATRNDDKGSLGDAIADSICDALEKAINEFAEQRHLETRPFMGKSDSTRSLISMARQLELARKAVAVPLRQNGKILPSSNETKSVREAHVCPICLVRPSSKSQDKQAPCAVCQERRRGRLDVWLDDKVDKDTIWVSEVADHNDRVALLTFSVGLECWLDGSAVDSLRAQSISDWRLHNASFGSATNPVDGGKAFVSLKGELRSRLSSFDKQDTLLRNLHDGFQHDFSWESFFQKIVEDRTDAPSWSSLTPDECAAWLAHQLFRKNASPGRVYRFWRTSEAFFGRLFDSIRERASAHGNRWRARRLVLKASGGTWNDRETYHGTWRGAPLGVLYRKATQDFVTITNLARSLGATEDHNVLEGQTITVTGDDLKVKQALAITTIEEHIGHLGVYHPIIPLEVSPRRFRVLVPLECAEDILCNAKERWEREFGRVWDRMPLRVGVVAFPRMTPFQAVVEAARNLEDDLAMRTTELWRVAENVRRDGVVATRWIREGDDESELSATQCCLPDGRQDVYYPYFAVEDKNTRMVRDFQHPRGQVYRHGADLRPGDGATIQPSRVATVFLESTAMRFEPTEVGYLSELDQRTALWALISHHAPSMSALRSALSIIEDARESWPARAPSSQERETWLSFVRAVLHDKLDTHGAALDTLVDAARTGVLLRTLRWNLQILKHDLGVTND